MTGTWSNLRLNPREILPRVNSLCYHSDMSVNDVSRDMERISLQLL
jgi:hypothetical protein